MIRVEVEDAEIAAGLRALRAVLADLTPVMQDIGEYLVTSTRARFATGAAPDGTPWAPKKPATMAAYARRGDRADPRPLFGPSGMLSQQISYTARPDAVEWGSSRIYAAAMQFGAAQGAFGRTRRGGPIPWGGIPARPFLGLSEADRASVLDIVAEHLEGAAKAP